MLVIFTAYIHQKINLHNEFDYNNITQTKSTIAISRFAVAPLLLAAFMNDESKVLNQTQMHSKIKRTGKSVSEIHVATAVLNLQPRNIVFSVRDH